VPLSFPPFYAALSNLGGFVGASASLPEAGAGLAAKVLHRT